MQPTLNSHRSSFLTRSRAALALGCLAVFSLSAQVQAVTIDFSTAPMFETDLPWSEKGFTLSKLSGLAVVRGDYGTVGNPTTLAFGDRGGSVRLTRTDNGLFDLEELEVDRNGGGLTPVYHPTRLETSTGHTVGITLEGIYIFSGYEGLSWVDIIFEVPAATRSSYNPLIDNIVVKNSVSNVPDAGSTGWLLSGALGVFGLWQQRLRRP